METFIEISSCGRMFTVENYGLVMNNPIFEAFQYEMNPEDLKEQYDNEDGETELVVKYHRHPDHRRNGESLLIHIYFNGKFVFEKTEYLERPSHMRGQLNECLTYYKKLKFVDK
jgi:hypothetical protein